VPRDITALAFARSGEAAPRTYVPGSRVKRGGREAAMSIKRSALEGMTAAAASAEKARAKKGYALEG
jgi:hypothetical protein